jgi:hypothetical protein
MGCSFGLDAEHFHFARERGSDRRPRLDDAVPPEA